MVRKRSNLQKSKGEPALWAKCPRDVSLRDAGVELFIGTVSASRCLLQTTQRKQL